MISRLVYFVTLIGSFCNSVSFVSILDDNESFPSFVILRSSSFFFSMLSVNGMSYSNLTLLNSFRC